MKLDIYVHQNQSFDHFIKFAFIFKIHLNSLKFDVLISNFSFSTIDLTSPRYIHHTHHFMNPSAFLIKHCKQMSKLDSLDWRPYTYFVRWKSVIFITQSLLSHFQPLLVPGSCIFRGFWWMFLARKPSFGRIGGLLIWSAHNLQRSYWQLQSWLRHV